MKRQVTMLLGAAALAVLAAAPASAATLCVKPTGSPTGNPCYSLIGYAVANAAAGDIISVASGVYKETAAIVIPASLTPLKIVGPSSAIVDNEVGTGLNDYTFEVQAPAVTIQGLTLRNGRDYGIRVEGGADNFLLYGSTINGSNSTCVRIDSNDAVVKSSKFYGCDSDGIEFYGKNISVTNSTFRNIDSYALYGSATDHDFGDVVFSHNTVTGSFNAAVYFYTGYNTTVSPGVQTATIQSNSISHLDSYGIYIDSDVNHTPGTAVVTGNKIANVNNAAIYLGNMDANLIQANSIKHAMDSYGIYVEGGGAHTIAANSVSATYESGIYLTHKATGNEPDGTTIKLNKVSDVPYSSGIHAEYGSGMTISNNTVSSTETGIYASQADKAVMIANNVSNTGYSGIDVYCTNAAGTADTCTGATISNNKITGVFDDYGIDFSGGNGTPAGAIQISGNVVKNTVYSCFYVDADGVAFTHNQALYCGYGSNSSESEGYELYGDAATFTSNVARFVGGDGFYLQGSGATLTANTADHNSEDGFDLHNSTSGTLTLNANHALFNTGSGFEIDSTDTVPTTGSLNTASNNGINSCDAGTGTTMLVNGVAPTTGTCTEAGGYIGD